MNLLRRIPLVLSTVALAAAPVGATPADDQKLAEDDRVSELERKVEILTDELARTREEMGVPEGHRVRVRLALLDLAHHVDCGSITWGLMRDAVTLVMHYPTLGRQALPLLLP